jgi:hypothetical protein
MIATGHNGVGALVGLTTIALADGYGLEAPTTYILALILGIISHYLADSIPHGHIWTTNVRENLRKIILGDLFGTFAIIALVAFIKFGVSEAFFIIMFAILGAQLPDVIGGLEYIGKLPKRGLLIWEYKLHQYIAHWHGYEEHGLPWRTRDVWQIMVYLSSLYLIFRM